MSMASDRFDLRRRVDRRTFLVDNLLNMAATPIIGAGIAGAAVSILSEKQMAADQRELDGIMAELGHMVAAKMRHDPLAPVPAPAESNRFGAVDQLGRYATEKELFEIHAERLDDGSMKSLQVIIISCEAPPVWFSLSFVFGPEGKGYNAFISTSILTKEFVEQWIDGGYPRPESYSPIPSVDGATKRVKKMLATLKDLPLDSRLTGQGLAHIADRYHEDEQSPRTKKMEA